MSSRAPVGYLAVTANPITTNQGCKSFVPRHSIDPEFLLFALRYHMPEIIQQGSGTTFVEVSKKTLENFEIDIPELSEQRRIVGILKEALADVREAKEALERVPKQMKQFRQAVLAQAFRGELTADWREANADRFREAAEWFDNQFGKPNPTQPSPILTADQLATIPDKVREWLPGDRLRLVVNRCSLAKSRKAGRLWGGGSTASLTDDDLASVPGSWDWVKVRDLGADPVNSVQVGPMSMQSRDFADHGVPVLNVGCVQNGWFDKSKLDFMPESKATEFSRYRVAPADIMFTRSGTVGRCALATADEDGYLMTFHLLRVRPDANLVLPPYAVFAFRGAPTITWQAQESSVGSTRAGFNTNLLANIDFPLPPIAEQQELVRRIEGLFAEAAATEAAAATALGNLRRLEQSTLQGAFRGEL